MTDKPYQLISELEGALHRLPRVPLANLPTPLQPCPRLSSALGGPPIWFKRDDLTGLALSGNKSRMFEYLFGAAKAEGIDAFVAGAGVQSNYCRQLAAACARLGIECHLVLRRVRGHEDDKIQGGLLLDLLCGAGVEIIDGGWDELRGAIAMKARDLRAAGKRVWVAGVGDETNMALHTCGYVQAALEMARQSEQMGVALNEVWLCSTDMTQAGLALGFKHLRIPARVVGVPALPKPIAPGRTFPDIIAQTANECAELLGLSTRLSPAEVVSLDGYAGSEYGAVTSSALEALQLLARCEAILLDPVYTAKAFSALIDHIRQGRIHRDSPVVFVHTGGFPAVFAYADALVPDFTASAGNSSLKASAPPRR